MSDQGLRSTLDGCIVCGAKLPERAQQYGDPYCSSSCCREDNGVPLPVGEMCRTDEERKKAHAWNKGRRRHGTESMYRTGCKCHRCRAAIRKARARRREEALSPKQREALALVERANGRATMTWAASYYDETAGRAFVNAQTARWLVERGLLEKLTDDEFCLVAAEVASLIA